ncbi:MAG: hypothetical protein CMJ42_12295 [Phyllobacteriaceae bacterium]|nr:hypothetical protein [Phyllobacteriaceae bacterium]MBA91710.1 hypothetical protein [Phyllobacteriaceae bacterium]
MNQQKGKRPEDLQESDFAEERMGNNRLQGNDQESVHNQRHAVPDVKQEADDVMESFEKLDKDKRARADLNKGARGNGNKD